MFFSISHLVVISLMSHCNRSVRLEHIKMRLVQQENCASLALLSNFHIGLCTPMFEVPNPSLILFCIIANEVWNICIPISASYITIIEILPGADC
jgi:hypothetical protein